MAHEAIESITWKDYPLTDTPITAQNLNKMARSIDILDDGLTEAEKDLDEGLADVRKELNEAVDELKKSVRDGKSLIASAITEKGVATAADATFATMATNIRAINDWKDVRLLEVRLNTYCQASYQAGTGTAILDVITNGKESQANLLSDGYCIARSNEGTTGETRVTSIDSASVLGRDIYINFTIYGFSDDWGNRSGYGHGQVVVNMDSAACTLTNQAEVSGTGSRISSATASRKR